MDFVAKNGIGGCITSLLRQFLATSVDVGVAFSHSLSHKSASDSRTNYTVHICDANFKQAPDMLTLSSWYNDQVHNDTPIVLIIDDLERCCGSVLSDFILLLRFATSSHLIYAHCSLHT